jgi:parallel beta-helix repeat protein
MRSLFLLLLIVAMLCPAVALATDVEGDVWGTWTRDNSPYNVIGEIRVPPESTLVIEPGVVVNFQGHYKFIVDSLATLLAVGTETDSILFSTEDPDIGWHGIRFMQASSRSRISYCHLEYGKAFDPWPDNLGGAVYCYYSSPTISSNTIKENTANQGGGIFCDTLSSTLIEGNSIMSNRATSVSWAWGGGVCCACSSPVIRDNFIVGNSATATLARGGGISCRESSPTIEGNSLNGNFAKGTQVGSGGAISCYGSGPTITSNLVTDNWAMSMAMGWGAGGGIACEDSSDSYISYNIISGNSADSSGGGGIFCSGNSNAEIVYNAITENRDWQGGGILCVGSCPVIIGNIISGNSGSGICCDGASPTISDNNIHHNTAGSGAGIVCYWDSSPSISRNEISQNLAPYTYSQGGGIYCYQSSPRIDSNWITENVATYAGGGIYCRESNSTITNNTISANTSGDRGGGIVCTHESNDTISHNTISLNSARLGGGIFCFYRSSPTITNVTVSRNGAGEKGGGLYCLNECNPTVTNTILWEDEAPSGPEICAEENSEPYVSYCDVEGGWPGIENIDCDPLFRDPANGDYQITWENYPVPDSTKSCCIDAGDPISPKDPDNTRADIGAFYFHQYLNVEIECECMTPVLCRGKDLYFKVIVTNNTHDTVSGTLIFRAYADFHCDPQNILVTIPRFRTYDPGENIAHYFFKVPGLVPPDEYSISVEGRLRDSGLFCCMNATIIQCEPWKRVSNTAWQLVEVSRPGAFLPTAVSLEQNYPNPFNVTTKINYQLPVDSWVKLEVYNVLGEKVVTLADEKQEAGYKSVIWEGSELSSGLYFYKLTAGDFTETKRMMLVK